MGEYETPVKQFNADSVVLTEQVGDMTATNGRLIVSGAKLWIGNGTTWAVVGDQTV